MVRVRVRVRARAVLRVRVRVVVRVRVRVVVRVGVKLDPEGLFSVGAEASSKTVLLPITSDLILTLTLTKPRTRSTLIPTLVILLGITPRSS